MRGCFEYRKVLEGYSIELLVQNLVVFDGMPVDFTLLETIFNLEFDISE